MYLSAYIPVYSGVLTYPGYIYYAAPCLNMELNHSSKIQHTVIFEMLCNLLSIFQNIPADKQRLIFRGKVLQDDKLLSEYGMHICSFCKHCDNT